ncbi:MAG: hypothetical protein ACXVPQ_09440 [Bacteroidia bacterium]
MSTILKSSPDKLKRFFLMVLCVAISAAYAQPAKEVKLSAAEAEKKFQAGNYEDALDDFLQLLTQDPKNELYNYNAGVCYLNTNINKAKAVPYLELVTRKEKHNPNADFLLGRAYQYANRFDEAAATFEKFKASGKGSEENLRACYYEIQNCQNAKEIIKYPVNVSFQSLGKGIINSEFADYYPFVTEDEAFIVFNSKRPVNLDEPKPESGQYANSIFISKVVNGEFMQASVIGEPICKGNSGEEMIGMNAKGDILLLYKPDYKGAGRIYISKSDESGQFSKPELLPAPINGVGDEIAACISNDGNTIYFASDRKGSMGGTDIYMCRKMFNGKWGDPRNMGPGINSVLDEDFPNISPDGRTLYFSSKGHASMGGYDIFKAAWNDSVRQFTNPKNLGYPINTSYDDMNFRISKSGRYGYLAAVRGGGSGDYDIYRVTFNDVETDYTVMIGQIKAKDNSEVSFRDVFITVNDNITGELVGNYIPNPANGRSVMILPPGKYILNVEAPGFKNYSMPIEIYDKVSYQSEKSFLVELKK